MNLISWRRCVISFCIVVMLYILVSLFVSCSHTGVGTVSPQGKACLSYDLTVGNEPAVSEVSQPVKVELEVPNAILPALPTE